jgi:hypothetical protein
MMFRFSLLIFSWWVFSAHADLYRWVDPETGSVKFSSYPPPWYGNESLQRRAPRVEHIPAKGAPGAGARIDSPVDAPRDAQSLDALERQRKAVLQQLSTSTGSPGAGTQKQLESLAAVMEQLDKLNPEGAAARRAETEAVLQKLIQGAPR